MIIQFSDTELEQVHRLAMIRHNSAGIAVEPKYSKLSAYEIDLLGAMGEAAVSKLFEWAVSTMLFTNKDDGVDFKTSVGSVQVKTAASFKQLNFYQRVPAFVADLGLFARLPEELPIGDEREFDDLGFRVELVGWFTAEVWRSKHRVFTNDSGRVSYRLPVSEMNRNFSELVFGVGNV